MDTSKLKFLNWGVNEDTPEHTIGRLRITNAIIATMWIASIFQTSALALGGAYRMALVNSSAILVIGSGLLLMKNGWTRAARMLVVYGGMVGTYFVCSQGGLEAGFHIILFFGAALTAFFFGPEDKIAVLIGFLLSVGVYLALEFNNFQPLVGTAMDITPDGFRLVRIFTFVILASLLYFMVIHFLHTFRQNQERLANSSKMAALGQMAAGMTHELNDPLAVIIGHAELLSKLSKKSNIEGSELASAADAMVRMGQRMSALIKGLSMVSREGRGDKPERVALSAVVDSTLGFCQARIKNLGIELRTSISNELSFSGKESQVSQVLLNLLNNSIDALINSPSGKRWIEISSGSSTSWIEIVVTDSGTGISAKTAKRIFEPFFTTKPVGKGTGLGLSIARGIVKEHGGDLIYDESSPNTRFVVRLPSPTK